VRRTHDIFREQTDRLHELLDSGRPTLVVLDSMLGWRSRAGYRSSLYTIGPQGLRGSRVYAAEPAPGVLRVTAFGASFVFGSEVGDTSAWPSVVEREFPGIEVPNYGVGGYGVDQAFLEYLAHGQDLHPQAVLVGITPDDLGRLVNVYRRFLSNREPPLFKPRFRVSGGGALELAPGLPPSEADYERIERHPRDVVPYGRLDYWYKSSVYGDPLYDYSAAVRLLTALWIRISRRYFDGNRLYVGPYANPESEAFKIQVALLERMADSVERRGASPIIVFFPDRDALGRALRGLTPSYQPFLDTLRAHGLQPLDAAAAFPVAQANQARLWFMPGGHYSPVGNRLVARWLGRLLAERRERMNPSRAEPVRRERN